MMKAAQTKAKAKPRESLLRPGVEAEAKSFDLVPHQANDSERLERLRQTEAEADAQCRDLVQPW